MTQGVSSALVGSPQVISLRFLNVWGMCTTYTSCQTAWSQLLWKYRWSVEADTGYDIQEIMFMGGCLMWNDSAVCRGSMWSDLWKSCEKESSIMFLFLYFVVSIGMSCYWRVSIKVSVLLQHVIMHPMSRRIPCETSQVHWNCLWMPIYVTPVLFLGWLCRWLLLILWILGGST